MKIKSSLMTEYLADGGALVVDEHAQLSHALEPQAAEVWTCLEQGTTETAAIAEKTGRSEAEVDEALAQIHTAGLLETSEGDSRREFLKRAAGLAGAAAGLTLIQSAATPTPAEAQSLGSDGAPSQDDIDGTGDGN